MRRFFSLAALSVVVGAAAPSAHAQPLTLQSWADETWLRFTDRSGMVDGRFSRSGILQRFHRRMDAQYDINLLTTRWPPDDDAEWHTHANGARIYAGSFERAEMATGLEMKVAAPLSRRWTLGVTVQSEHDLENRHDLLRAGVTRVLRRGVDAYVESSLKSDKADMDGTAGVRWRRRGVEARADVTVLDFANGVVSGNNRLLRDLLYDSTYRYARQPVALRTTLRTALGARAWAELQTAEAEPGRVTMERLPQPGGFAQGERAGYRGLLVGSRLGRAAQLGAFATTARARTERSPLAPAASSLDDFVLVEETRQAGVLGTAAPAARLHLSMWTAVTARTETGDHRHPDLTGAPADVHYADRAFDARLVTRYGAPAGRVQLVADAAYDDRHNVRGLGTVPGRQAVPHYSLMRAALMAGWRGPSRTEFLLGVRLEHDIDTPGGTLRRALSEAGYQGRGTFYW